MVFVIEFALDCMFAFCYRAESQPSTSKDVTSLSLPLSISFKAENYFLQQTLKDAEQKLGDCSLKFIKTLAKTTN